MEPREADLELIGERLCEQLAASRKVSAGEQVDLSCPMASPERTGSDGERPQVQPLPGQAPASEAGPEAAPGAPT
jgi:hypothetical protein